MLDQSYQQYWLKVTAFILGSAATIAIGLTLPIWIIPVALYSSCCQPSNDEEIELIENEEPEVEAEKSDSDIPDLDQVPVTDEQPVIEDQQSDDGIPDLDQVPVTDEQPVIEDGQSDDDIPDLDQVPVTDEQPVVEDQQPPLEMDTTSSQAGEVDNTNNGSKKSAPVRSIFSDSEDDLFISKPKLEINKKHSLFSDSDSEHEDDSAIDTTRFSARPIVTLQDLKGSSLVPPRANDEEDSDSRFPTLPPLHAPANASNDVAAPDLNDHQLVVISNPNPQDAMKIHYEAANFLLQTLDALNRYNDQQLAIIAQQEDQAAQEKQLQIQKRLEETNARIEERQNDDSEFDAELDLTAPNDQNDMLGESDIQLSDLMQQLASVSQQIRGTIVQFPIENGFADNIDPSRQLFGTRQSALDLHADRAMQSPMIDARLFLTLLNQMLNTQETTRILPATQMSTTVTAPSLGFERDESSAEISDDFSDLSANRNIPGFDEEENYVGSVKPAIPNEEMVNQVTNQILDQLFLEVLSELQQTRAPSAPTQLQTITAFNPADPTALLNSVARRKNQIIDLSKQFSASLNALRKEAARLGVNNSLSTNIKPNNLSFGLHRPTLDLPPDIKMTSSPMRDAHLFSHHQAVLLRRMFQAAQAANVLPQTQMRVAFQNQPSKEQQKFNELRADIASFETKLRQQEANLKADLELLENLQIQGEGPSAPAAPRASAPIRGDLPIHLSRRKEKAFTAALLMAGAKTTKPVKPLTNLEKLQAKKAQFINQRKHK